MALGNASNICHFPQKSSVGSGMGWGPQSSPCRPCRPSRRPLCLVAEFKFVFHAYHHKFELASHSSLLHRDRRCCPRRRREFEPDGSTAFYRLHNEARDLKVRVDVDKDTRSLSTARVYVPGHGARSAAGPA